MDAAAQVGEVLDGLQAPLGFGRQAGQRGCQQVAEGFLVAASHTPAHLVQVAQAEVLRLVDDDGVGVGDVDAALDDGGGNEYVVVVIHEVEDNLLQFGRLHLAVTDAHAAVGYVALDEGLQLGQVGDAVVHEEHLPVAAHLEVDGVDDDFLVEGMHLCLNRVAVGWRRLDDAEVTRTHQ